MLQDDWWMRVFWPNSRLHRVEAHAVRLPHAIAAAFADVLVDHQAQRRLFQLAARTLAALLGGALLIVDDDRDAGDLFQLAQHVRQIVAIAHGRRCPPASRRAYFSRSSASTTVLRTPSASSFRVRSGIGQRARRLLAARHRDRAVVENLVGDVDARRHAGGNRHRARVEVRAVADVLENVLPLDERRHADPRRALAAHVREERIAAVDVRQLMPPCAWQPMPPPATWPSSSTVERLCGQPEQKLG